MIANIDWGSIAENLIMLVFFVGIGAFWASAMEATIDANTTIRECKNRKATKRR